MNKLLFYTALLFASVSFSSLSLAAECSGSNQEYEVGEATQVAAVFLAIGGELTSGSATSTTCKNTNNDFILNVVVNNAPTPTLWKVSVDLQTCSASGLSLSFENPSDLDCDLASAKTMSLPYNL